MSIEYVLKVGSRRYSIEYRTVLSNKQTINYKSMFLCDMCEIYHV